MNYDEYVALAHQGAEADAAGDFEKAVNIFYQLLSTDISDVDKAMMCHNIGVIQEKMGKEQEALASFERGMSYERVHGRIVVAEQRAAYLYRLGRLADSLRAYEELLYRSSLTEEEKHRMKYNVAALRGELGKV